MSRYQHFFDWTMTLDEETERAVSALGVHFLGGLLEQREELDTMFSHCPSSTPKSHEASAALAVQAEDSPYIPSVESAACQAESQCKSMASQTEEFLDILNCCPYGARLPVHKHYVKTMEFPNGRIETTRKIMVNCAEYPRPAYKEVSERQTIVFFCFFFAGYFFCRSFAS